MMLAITRRELRSLIYSPLIWSLAGVMQLIAAWLFLVQLEDYLEIQPRLATLESPPGITDLVVAPLLEAMASLSLLIIPLLTMRMLSEEYREGTLDLLFSSPLKMRQIVLGKYIALLLLLVPLVALLALMPLSLLLGGSLDLGRLTSGLLGLMLLLASAAAIGLYLSSLTSQPAVAAIATYGLLLFLWIINLAGSNGNNSSRLFDWLALSSHFQRLLSGLVFSGDIAYYLLLIGLCLSLTMRRLDSRRLQG